PSKARRQPLAGATRSRRSGLREDLLEARIPADRVELRITQVEPEFDATRSYPFEERERTLALSDGHQRGAEPVVTRRRSIRHGHLADQASDPRASRPAVASRRVEHRQDCFPGNRDPGAEPHGGLAILAGSRQLAQVQLEQGAKRVRELERW